MTDISMRPKRKRTFAQNFVRILNRDKYLYLIMLLPTIYYILFCYYPMYGVTLAFKQYKPKLGILGSPWASHSGMKYILQIVKDPYFWTVFKNTIVLNVLNLAITFPIPIALALMLNEVRSSKYKRIVQTVTYLPHFLSTVVVVGMMTSMFSSGGIVNDLLGKLGLGPYQFLNDAQYFRPMYIGSNIWQNMGWDSIIYLSALSALDMELYEAARIDGAGRWKQTIHITLPGITPTIIILLILNMGKIMNVSYQKILLMMTGSNQSVSDVISTYVYRRGITKADFSYATAINLFQSLISLLFVTVTNQISRKCSETSLW